MTPDPLEYDKRINLPLRLSAGSVTILESHFESLPPTGRADVLACLFRERPLAGWRSYEGCTRLIDLRVDPDVRFASLTKGTRYEINRARNRDGVETSVLSSPIREQLDEFVAYYDQFAASKGLAVADRQHLQALAATQRAALSFARAVDGRLLSAHAYLLGHDRARLTHSASLFRLEQDAAARGQIGRANRLLHWDDLIAFRSAGKAWYDFGGWYRGSRDEALLKINAFKEEFGGELAGEWSSFKAGSQRGRLYLGLRDLMLRRKE